MWTQCRAQIKTIIQTAITGGSSAMAVVYDHPTSTETMYPAVQIMGSDSESVYGSGSPSNASIHTAVFTIRALYTISDEDQATAEAKLDTVLDELIILFSNPDVMGGVADFVEPISGSWGYQDRANGQVRTAEIKVRCTKYY